MTKVLSMLFLLHWKKRNSSAFGYHFQNPLANRQQSTVSSFDTDLQDELEIAEQQSIPCCCSRSSRRRDVLFGIPRAAASLSLLVQPCNGLSPQDAAKDYDTYAPTYNELDGGQAASILGIDDARAQLLSQAKGDVLEIGVGTGLNLGWYDPQKISSLTLVDISDGMLSEAESRWATLETPLRDVPVKFVKADATSELVQCFGGGSFDTVVDTFSLCVFGNEGAMNSLKQLKTVVKDEAAGGQVLLLENSRSSNPLLGLYQDATAEAAASMGGKGCVYNQDVGRLLRESKMKIRKEEQFAAGVFRSFVCTISS